MSKTILQMHFDFTGPFGEEMARQLAGLAESINDEPGFVWKIWTESQENSEAGGIYLFEDETSAQVYVRKHTARLSAMGVCEVVFKIFDVNEKLTHLNHGPA